MDLARFGLTSRPFRPTPVRESYHAVPSHDDALAELLSAYESDEGIALLDGPLGSGKTLTLLRFLDALPSSAHPILLPPTKFHRPADLYQAILFDLGKPYRDLGEQELRLNVFDHLLSELTAKKRTVIVVDDAHLLNDNLLEEIRLLDNLEACGVKAVFAVLAGLPELRERLGSVALSALSQRIGCKPHIERLSREESARYLRGQLEHCGGDADSLFTDEAIELIAVHGRGVPRVLNQLASSAFAVAERAGQNVIDAEVAYEALSRAGMEIEEIETGDSTPARPAYSAGAARSMDAETSQSGEDGESGSPRSPKQKVRKRRAA